MRRYLALGAALGFCAASAFGAGSVVPTVPSTGAVLDGPDLDEIVRIVKQQTILSGVTAAQMREASVHGIVKLLDETLRQPPYALAVRPAARSPFEEPEERPINAFYTPRDYRLWRQEMQGKFGGIGARIGVRLQRAEWATSAGAVTSETSTIEVLGPIPGGAAEKAGLKKGDLILAIDGKSVAGATLAEIVEQLRGDEGTTVGLKVLRQPNPPYEVRITRTQVRLAPVEFEKLAGGVGCLRITTLNPETRPALERALTAAREAGAGGLVLDLRGCPGGVLDVAVEAASAFLPKGSPVVTLGKAGKADETLATAAAQLYDGPLVALVGPHTASGAEIVAAALQVHGRALVAGEPTFGKHTAETVFELHGGYAAKLSTAFFRRPGTKPGEGPGFPVQPDVPLASSRHREPDEPSTDAQLAAAAALVQWRGGKQQGQK
ncbi:MAG: PDZ domain-containing protein [Candidatus Wallbacteria bacterium]|nr:PDZ domain-containing protein [Candidatus Wallbacteria bacterium]